MNVWIISMPTMPSVKSSQIVAIWRITSLSARVARAK